MGLPLDSADNSALTWPLQSLISPADWPVVNNVYAIIPWSPIAFCLRSVFRCAQVQNRQAFEQDPGSGRMTGNRS